MNKQIPSTIPLLHICQYLDIELQSRHRSSDHLSKNADSHSVCGTLGTRCSFIAKGYVSNNTVLLNMGWQNVWCTCKETCRDACYNIEQKKRTVSLDSEAKATQQQCHKVVIYYPSRMDLSMHSLQNRCRHSITVLVFRMMPISIRWFHNQ